MGIDRKLSNKENKTKKGIINKDHGSENKNMKEIGSFSVIEFRKQLKQGNSLLALKQFISAIKNSKEHNYVVEYLNIGGNYLELLHSLKLNKVTMIWVFELVTLILAKIGPDYPQYYVSTYELCCYVLENYMPLIIKMIDLRSPSRETYVSLKLLATMATSVFNLVKYTSSQICFGETNFEQLVEIGKIDGVHDFLTKFLSTGYLPGLIDILKQIRTVTIVLQPMFEGANKQHNVRSKL